MAHPLKFVPQKLYSLGKDGAGLGVLIQSAAISRSGLKYEHVMRFLNLRRGGCSPIGV